MGLLRISAHSSRELQAILLAAKAVPKETRAQIRKHTRQILAPEWSRAMTEHATTRVEHLVLARTARVAVSDRNVQLKTASVGRALSGGLKPSVNWAQIEFGAAPQRRSYTGRRGGTTYQIRNRSTRNQLRRPNRSGYVFYPSAANIIPRLAALWAQTTARTIHEAFEGKK